MIMRVDFFTSGLFLTFVYVLKILFLFNKSKGIRVDNINESHDIFLPFIIKDRFPFWEKERIFLKEKMIHV